MNDKDSPDMAVILVILVCLVPILLLAFNEDLREAAFKQWFCNNGRIKIVAVVKNRPMMAYRCQGP